ncbi:hypothetical protein [Caulobacter endophyticus]|uniref:hypothetical protein n=1 Tax=Caulobacter endophyticus TaxID=2172652 RepID=UPI00240EC7CD|nr:hypothetical protein [Caulobacter endophyticus]MDG2528341.1 hypothetical protein [Caulobacter endophyticus]
MDDNRPPYFRSVVRTDNGAAFLGRVIEKPDLFGNRPQAGPGKALGPERRLRERCYRSLLSRELACLCTAVALFGRSGAFAALRDEVLLRRWPATLRRFEKQRLKYDAFCAKPENRGRIYSVRRRGLKVSIIY